MLFSINFRVVILIALGLIVNSQFTLNSTGGTFPKDLMLEYAFAYETASNDVIHYFSGGTTTAKCNIMGYRHIGNTDPKYPALDFKLREMETDMCTDVCKRPICDYDSSISPRVDFISGSRLPKKPIIDFGISEVPFDAIDYKYYTDLQMFPAFAGAIVPIYTLPGIPKGSGPITFSRETLANIFLGKIAHWNHSDILSDNKNSSSYGYLSTCKERIKLAVRQDSSGISKIFLQALMSFDPITGPNGLYSVTNTIGKTSNPAKPLWCDPLTDEVQVYSISNCIDSLVSKTVTLAALSASRDIKSLSFPCNATAAALTDAFATQLNLTVSVSLSTDQSSGNRTYRVGFSDNKLFAKNWYLPTVNSSQAAVSVRSLQEGGMWNSHYTISDYYVTPEIQSLFVLQAPNPAVLIKLSYMGSIAKLAIDSSAAPDLSSLIMESLKNLSLSVLNVTKLSSVSSLGSAEYQITFSPDKYKNVALLQALAVLKSNNVASNAVAVLQFLQLNNFPRFNNTLNSVGVATGGQNTCYKRGLNYEPLIYLYAALTELTTLVQETPYSIGYASLTDAISHYTPFATLINKAGTRVVANADSVSYAVMEKGGNLDSYLNSPIVDSSSLKAWPISGYNYILLRKNHHLGTCARRKAAMSFLYNFYYSNIRNVIAQRLGYSSMPDFIRDTIVATMINSVKCEDGSFAMAKYRVDVKNIHTSYAFHPILNIYLSSYKNIDPNVVWEPVTKYLSSDVYNAFKTNPDNSTGMFTLFSSREQKLAKFSSEKLQLLTSAFAHVAVAIIYRLDGFPLPLNITKDILSGIYTGSIQYWDDPLLLKANDGAKQFLPHKSIKVVVRDIASDTNSILFRFLSINTTAFSSAYNKSIGTDMSLLNFSSRIPGNRLLVADTSIGLDSRVSNFDGSIGYYLQTNAPVSNIAGFCKSPDCSDGVIFPNDNGKSIAACAKDPTTVVSFGSHLSSYDLMLSSSPGCYPIVGTIDATIFNGQSQSCPATPMLTPYSNIGSQTFDSNLVFTRIQFFQLLYYDISIVNPLHVNSVEATSLPDRHTAWSNICNVQCANYSLGYAFCGYVDCAWEKGDFDQIVSACDSISSTRSVSYALRNGSTCILRNQMPVVEIACDYIPSDSPIGIFVYVLCALGVFVSASTLILTIIYRKNKVLKKSQLIFVYAFLLGAILINFFIPFLVGPNSSAICLARPWYFNFAATIMMAPLAMKLHRVDVLFNNKQLKKIKVTNLQVAGQILMVLIGDICILILWTVIEKPTSIESKIAYPSTLGVVVDVGCNTGLQSKFEIIMLAYKCLIIIFALIKAVRTWHIPADISEAKQFAVAIYNIVVLGGIGYFVGALLSQGAASTGLILRCIGLFVSSTASVILIMTRKFLEIEGVRSCLFYGNAKIGDMHHPAKMLEDLSTESSKLSKSKPSSSGHESYISSISTTEGNVHPNKVIQAHTDEPFTLLDTLAGDVPI